MLLLKRKFKRDVPKESLGDVENGIRRIHGNRAIAKSVRAADRENLRLLKQFKAARERARIELGFRRAQMPATAVESCANMANVAETRQRQQNLFGKRNGPPTQKIERNFNPVGTQGFQQQQQLGVSNTAVVNSIPNVNAIRRSVNRSLFGAALSPASTTPAQSSMGSSEAEYWASFSGIGEHGKGNRSRSRVGSGWALAGIPVTRQDAHNVQQAMAEITRGDGSESSGHENECRSIFSSITRTQPSKSGLRTFSDKPPVPSLIRNVLPPPSLLKGKPVSTYTSSTAPSSIIQSPWVSRSSKPGYEAVTKKYSIRQLLDILTGHAIPPTSELTNCMFNPVPHNADENLFRSDSDDIVHTPVPKPITMRKRDFLPTPDGLLQQKQELSSVHLRNSPRQKNAFDEGSPKSIASSIPVFQEPLPPVASELSPIPVFQEAPSTGRFGKLPSQSKLEHKRLHRITRHGGRPLQDINDKWDQNYHFSPNPNVNTHPNTILDTHGMKRSVKFLTDSSDNINIEFLGSQSTQGSCLDNDQIPIWNPDQTPENSTPTKSLDSNFNPTEDWLMPNPQKSRVVNTTPVWGSNNIENYTGQVCHLADENKENFTSPAWITNQSNENCAESDAFAEFQAQIQKVSDAVTSVDLTNIIESTGFQTSPYFGSQTDQQVSESSAHLISDFSMNDMPFIDTQATFNY